MFVCFSLYLRYVHGVRDYKSSPLITIFFTDSLIALMALMATGVMTFVLFFKTPYKRHLAERQTTQHVIPNHPETPKITDVEDRL